MATFTAKSESQARSQATATSNVRWRTPERSSQLGNIRRQPLPVSNDIPLGSQGHLNYQSLIAVADQSSSLPNVRNRETLISSSSYTLDRIEEKIGADHIILGAKFLLHSCLTYPFIVFSRQCQINPYYNIGSIYIAPLRTINIMNNITSSQGVISWWRGFKPHVISVLGRPFAAAALTWIAERWSRNKRLSNLWNWIRSNFIHLVINGLSYVICLPLTSFILMECVQHTQQRTYSPDYYGFKELTLERPTFVSSNSLKHLSFLQLLTPTVFVNVFQDILAEQVLKFVTLCPPIKEANNPNSSNLSIWNLHKKLWASYITSVIVDLTMYPFKTVMVRLNLQGLPILVENVETGTSVQYIMTFYSGPIDCVQGIWEAEGVLGFYKGLSSILLQHFVYGLSLIILWRIIVEWDKMKETNK